MKINNYPLLFIFYFLLTPVIAQEEAKPSYDFTRSKTILKTNPGTMINGDFPLYLEARMNRRWSLEFGPGLLMGYYINDFPHIIFEPPDSYGLFYGHRPKIGYSFRTSLRFYYKIKGKTNMYFEPFGRKRIYYFKEFKSRFVINDIALKSGIQFNPKHNIVFDIYIGFGFRIPKIKLQSGSTLGHEDEVYLITPIGVKLGLLLNNKN